MTGEESICKVYLRKILILYTKSSYNLIRKRWNNKKYTKAILAISHETYGDAINE